MRSVMTSKKQEITMKIKKLLISIVFIASSVVSTTVLSAGVVVTLTVSKNDTYASTCSRTCKTVDSCFEQAKKLDLNAGKRGLLKSIVIRANNKVLLERNYRNKR